MTYEDVNQLIASIAEALGCEYSYYSEDEADMVKAPYLLFDYPDRDDFYADDKNYAIIQRVSIEYDSKKKDIDSEMVVESILDSNDLTYLKEETRIEGMDVFEVMYTMEVLING